MWRRRALLGGATLGAMGLGSGGYARFVEPHRLVVRHHALAPPGWPAGQKLRVCVVADLHACEPSTPLDQVAALVEQANALRPDLTVLLGDYASEGRFVSRAYAPAEIARALAGLRAPLGVLAIAGNHDWWYDEQAMRDRRGVPGHLRALGEAGIHILGNGGVRLRGPDGRPFWVLGTDSQCAFSMRRNAWRGPADLNRALATLTDDAPALLLLHEPDLFTQVPPRVALTLAGHTHGGQVRLLGRALTVPSNYGTRFAYGLVEEAGRQMLVSGGIGCSILPIRFAAPPELLLVELGQAV